MALRTVKDTLSNGSTYELTTFKSRETFKIKMNLIKLLGKPLISLIGKVTENEEGEQFIDKEAITPLIDQLVDRVNEDGYELIEQLTKDVKIDGELVDIEEFYSGEIALMYEVALKTIQANYGSLMSLVGISPTHSLSQVLKGTMQGQ